MTNLAGIGARMAAARANKPASQVKAAAMLEISDKAYKNYETEKRSLPLETAVAFCDAFDVDLQWLVFGTKAGASEKGYGRFSEAIEALMAEAQDRKIALSPNRAARIGGYLLRICDEKGTSPKAEIGPIFEMFYDE